MADNIRIPKRVGAVKLPKKVRRKAKKAFKAATSPFVRDFASAAMTAARRARREGDAEAGDRREREEHNMCHETRIHIDGNKVAEAFRSAALAGLRRFLEGLEEGLKEAQADAGDKDDPQPDPRAKPKAAAKPKPAAKAEPKPKARKASPGSGKRPPRAPAGGA